MHRYASQLFCYGVRPRPLLAGVRRHIFDKVFVADDPAPAHWPGGRNFWARIGRSLLRGSWPDWSWSEDPSEGSICHGIPGMESQSLQEDVLEHVRNACPEQLRRPSQWKEGPMERSGIGGPCAWGFRQLAAWHSLRQPRFAYPCSETSSWDASGGEPGRSWEGPVVLILAVGSSAKDWASPGTNTTLHQERAGDLRIARTMSTVSIRYCSGVPESLRYSNVYQCIACTWDHVYRIKKSHGMSWQLCIYMHLLSFICICKSITADVWGHGSKNASGQVCSMLRTVHYGELWVDLTASRANGCPPAALSRSNPMSDRLNSLLNNPYFLVKEVESWCVQGLDWMYTYNIL